MFELLGLMLFGWLFLSAMRLLFEVAWGPVKMVTIILAFVTFSTLLSVLILAGEITLLILIALIGTVLRILKGCI